MATVGEIKAQVADFLDRNDSDVRIARWLRQAHKSIQRRHNYFAMESVAYTALVPDQATFTTPGDFKLPVALYVFDPFKNYIVRRFGKEDIEPLRAERMFNRKDVSIYSVWNNIIEINPAIAYDEATLQLRLDYYAYLELPADDAGNFFTDKGEDYLIYKTLEDSAPFFGADTRLTMWASKATVAYNELRNADIEARYNPGGPLIMRG